VLTLLVSVLLALAQDVVPVSTKIIGATGKHGNAGTETGTGTGTETGKHGNSLSDRASESELLESKAKGSTEC